MGNKKQKKDDTSSELSELFNKYKELNTNLDDLVNELKQKLNSPFPHSAWPLWEKLITDNITHFKIGTADSNKRIERFFILFNSFTTLYFENSSPSNIHNFFHSISNSAIYQCLKRKNPNEKKLLLGELIKRVDEKLDCVNSAGDVTITCKEIHVVFYHYLISYFQFKVSSSLNQVFSRHTFKYLHKSKHGIENQVDMPTLSYLALKRGPFSTWTLQIQAALLLNHQKLQELFFNLFYDSNSFFAFNQYIIKGFKITGSNAVKPIKQYNYNELKKLCLFYKRLCEVRDYIHRQNNRKTEVDAFENIILGKRSDLNEECFTSLAEAIKDFTIYTRLRMLETFLRFYANSRISGSFELLLKKLTAHEFAENSKKTESTAPTKKISNQYELKLITCNRPKKFSDESSKTSYELQEYIGKTSSEKLNNAPAKEPLSETKTLSPKPR